ncbi:MAG: hypothetical protein H0Z35_09715 [Thermoanaerobacteraceae bacterium]|nr:hypothetical protein [Thermoanaerobacteraceae bacterium]
MYVVAVRGTDEWYECKTELEAARKVRELLQRVPQERILLAEELELTVIDGEVTIVEGTEEEDML